MALDPFIGGATYVSIKDRKQSQARAIEYDDEVARLILSEDLPAAAATETQADAVA
jgi:hypothetical protein